MAHHTPPDTYPATTTRMRHRMPAGYLKTLADSTGATQTTIAEVVRNERTRSRYWPAVVALAEATEGHTQC